MSIQRLIAIALIFGAGAVGVTSSILGIVKVKKLNKKENDLIYSSGSGSSSMRV